MSFRFLSALNIMIVTGVLLAPTAVSYAVQDLQDLKAIVDSASTTINAAPNNSSWGFLNPAAGAGPSGTADLISNITTTVLHAMYLLDTNKTAWITVPNATNTTTSPPFPSASPSANVTLDEPYIDYITAIPTLSTALTTLGRAWHKEMNKPVWDAIDALQQTISTFQSSMLQADLIHSQAVLRTIRASTSLEDAQTAWSRLLNLPSSTKAGDVRRDVEKRMKKPLPVYGGYYSHKDLWGRDAKIGKSTVGSPKPNDAIVSWDEQQQAGRQPRPFIA